jgi:hypothetical protein
MHIQHLSVNRVMSALSLAVLGGGVLLLVLIRVYPYTYVFPAFPKLAHTGSGAAGDPINLIFIGNQSQITQSFQQAGWLVPDPITPLSSAKIAADSLAHRAYPTAPVSNLYVFGRVQDLAFERPTNDVQNRGHIRLWQTGTQVGGQPVWLGEASYDHGIELSGTNGLPTHHIEPTVDLERAAVGADLAQMGQVMAEASGAFTPPVFMAHNGGGDFYESDGDVLAITFAPAPLPFAPSAGLVPGLKHGLFQVYAALLTTPLLALVAALVGLALVVVGVWPLLQQRSQQLRTRAGSQRQ